MGQGNGDLGKKIDSLVRKCNELRSRILVELDEYNGFSSRANELEEMFLTFVVMPGSQLRAVSQRRKFLEREYNRIRKAIEQGAYEGPEELEHDIRQTLMHTEVAEDYDSDQTDESLKAMRPGIAMETIEADDVIDDVQKQELVKEFKRIVMPQVHPDTSDTPFEIFDVVYKAYERRDYLLMEAFIIKYRGDIVRSNEDDPLSFFDLVSTYSVQYSSVLERLRKRLEKLKRDIDFQDIENPQRVKQRMERQNREIRKAIYDESEKIIYLRSCLEDLGRLQTWRKGE